MEEKENSSESANSSISEYPINSKIQSDEIVRSHKKSFDSPEQGNEEASTQDLSLRLDLDESGTLKETQDQYRMFSRLGYSPEVTANTQYDKETQEYKMSKSIDVNTSVDELNDSQKNDSTTEPSKEQGTNIEVATVPITLGALKKRQLDSQVNSDDETKKQKLNEETSGKEDERDLFNTSDEDTFVTNILESDDSIRHVEENLQNHDPTQPIDKSVVTTIQIGSTLEEKEARAADLEDFVALNKETSSPKQCSSLDQTFHSLIDNSCIILEDSDKHVISGLSLNELSSQSKQQNIDEQDSGEPHNETTGKGSDDSLVFAKLTEISMKTICSQSNSSTDAPGDKINDGLYHCKMLESRVESSKDASKNQYLRFQEFTSSSSTHSTSSDNPETTKSPNNLNEDKNDQQLDQTTAITTAKPGQNEFKTPVSIKTASRSTEKVFCLKESDLNIVKIKWPDAYNYLKPNLKEISVQSRNALEQGKGKRNILEGSNESSNSKSSSSTGYVGDLGTSGTTDSTPSCTPPKEVETISKCGVILDDNNLDNNILVGTLPVKVSQIDSNSVQSKFSRKRESDTWSHDATFGSAIHFMETQKVTVPEVLDIDEYDDKVDSNKNQFLERNEVLQIKKRGKKKKNQNVGTKLNKNERRDVKDENKQIVNVQSLIQRPNNLDLDISKRVFPSTNPFTGKPKMNIGMQVFAKWSQQSEVRYYPGKISDVENYAVITQDDDDVKYYVVFEDGFEKGGLRWDEMIPVGMLEEGHGVYVEDIDSKENYCPAKLSTFPDFVKTDNKDKSENDIDVMYTVDYDKPKKGYPDPQFESERVSYKRVTLDKDQVINVRKTLGGCWNQSQTVKSKADMSLDNLILGKRRNRLSSNRKASPSQKTPKKVKEDDHHETATSGAKSKTLSNQSDVKTDSTTMTKSTKRKKGGNHVETSVTGDEADVAKVIPKNKPSRKVSSVKTKINIVTNEAATEISSSKKRRVGRTPSKEKQCKYLAEKQCVTTSKKPSSDIFSNINFVLTQGSRSFTSRNVTEISTSSLMEAETETGQDDQKYFNPKSIGFNRSKLKETLQVHGGTVLDGFPGNICPSPQPYLSKDGVQIPRIYVVSDRYCQTMSFLLAIGYGITRISHMWVIESILEGKQLPVDKYLLPIGWSMLEDRVIEQQEQCNEITKNGIFNKLHILISSALPNFCADWKPLLARLGAKVSCREKGSLGSALRAIDVVVIDDSNAPEAIIIDAAERNIPIVSSMWVIQSLINGRRVQYEKFSYFS